MYWGDKGDASEMYCAVHNYQCPLHGAGRDATVLLINPGMIPSGWICPQAVQEIGEFDYDADEMVERNERLGGRGGVSL